MRSHARKGTIPVEVRVDAKAAASIHLWCVKRMPGINVAVSTALAIGIETLVNMLPASDKFEFYGDAAAYLKQVMGTLNRHNKSGISAALQDALLEEGKNDYVKPEGPGILFTGPAKAASKLLKDMTPEEREAEARRIMESMRVRPRPTAEEKVSDDSVPVDIGSFEEQEAASLRAQKAGFLSAMRSSGASALDNTATSGDSSGEGGENG